MEGPDGEGGAAETRDLVLVAALVGVLALPHLLSGPDLTADDWVWVRNGEFLGWWDAGGSRQVGRPGAFALYALTFGVGGAHPLLHTIVQTLLWLGAGIAVLLALREVVPRGVALATTLVWLAIPSHLSLELWASTSQAWVAVALLALGCREAARWARGESRLLPSLVLLGAAGAFYEVAILAAPVAAWLVHRCITGRWKHAVLLWAGVAASAPLVWALGSASVYSPDVPTTESEWVRHLAGPIGMGIDVREQWVAAVVVVLFVVALVHPVRRTLAGSARQPWDGLAVGGAALVVCGVVPALRSYTIPVAMGDRLTAVSGLGAVAFWVGIAGRRVFATPMLGRAVFAGVGVVAIVGRIDMLDRWTSVGDAASRDAASLALRVDASPDGVLIVDGPIAARGDVYGLFDGWNTTAAVQVRTGRDDVVVRVDVRCARSGPRPTDPLEQDGRRPEDRVPDCDSA